MWRAGRWGCDCCHSGARSANPESGDGLNKIEIPGSTLRVNPRCAIAHRGNDEDMIKMFFPAAHEDARRALQKFIAAEINPFVDEWEKADIFPAHELFKKLGDLGFLGLNKPAEFAGQGLDYR